MVDLLGNYDLVFGVNGAVQIFGGLLILYIFFDKRTSSKTDGENEMGPIENQSVYCIDKRTSSKTDAANEMGIIENQSVNCIDKRTSSKTDGENEMGIIENQSVYYISTPMLNTSKRLYIHTKGNNRIASSWI